MSETATILISMLLGFSFGLITHEYLFPESKTVNEIEQNFKKSRIEGSTLDLKYNPETPKPKRFLGFLWKKKIKA